MKKNKKKDLRLRESEELGVVGPLVLLLPVGRVEGRELAVGRQAAPAVPPLLRRIELYC